MANNLDLQIVLAFFVLTLIDFAEIPSYYFAFLLFHWQLK